MKTFAPADNQSKHARTTAVFWVVVLVALYVLSCGPAIRFVLFLTEHGYGGDSGGDRLFEALEVVYAPLSWVYEHSPAKARRVFDWYTEFWWQ